jgi:hypothetical protein
MIVQQKNPAARGEAKRRGRNREEANANVLDDTSFFSIVYSLSKKIFVFRQIVCEI